MLHSSLSVAGGLLYKAGDLEEVFKRAARLLNATNLRGQRQSCATGEDVSLADLLAEAIADTGLSVDEARRLLLVLGAAREAIYERTLWRLAIDEAAAMVHRP